MESVIYRFPLDCHKTGSQKTLQGIGSGDSLSRTLYISLVAGSQPLEIDAEHAEAFIYVILPGEDSPSINACSIEDNVVKYTIHSTDITKAGDVRCQVKVIGTNPTTGTKKVVAAPRFTIEVNETENLDQIIQEGISSQTFEGSFTALEKAVAKAQAYYHSRLTAIEFDENYAFHAYFADGTEYINDDMSEAYAECIEKGTAAVEAAITARSYAVGDTESRDNETTDNAKYYAGVAQGAIADVEKTLKLVEEARDEVLKNSAYAVFKVDFTNGHLMWNSDNYNFGINTTTGELNWNPVVTTIEEEGEE